MGRNKRGQEREEERNDVGTIASFFFKPFSLDDREPKELSINGIGAGAPLRDYPQSHHARIPHSIQCHNTLLYRDE